MLPRHWHIGLQHHDGKAYSTGPVDGAAAGGNIPQEDGRACREESSAGSSDVGSPSSIEPAPGVDDDDDVGGYCCRGGVGGSVGGEVGSSRHHHIQRKSAPTS